MANTNIRTLKIFEFNRALSYVSEIIELGRKIHKMQEEFEILSAECCEWRKEEAETEEEKEYINQILENLVERIDEIKSEKQSSQKYCEELQYLVSKILEYVTKDGKRDVALREEEIQESFLEEYVYLLSEPVVDDSDPMLIDSFFNDKADFVMLLFEYYGNERESLLREIVNIESDEYLQGNLEDYFP